MTRTERLLRDESGMTYVFVGLGLTAMLSASMLAIDVGMLMTARSQAQNSADAGALAGATALVYDSYTDRTATGPAVTSALATARLNDVMAGEVTVAPRDVEFPNDPAGLPNRVRVTVYRRATADAATNNPVPTLIASYFGIRTADIGATATAEASPADAMTCVKPFTIPDRWIEVQTPPWDPDDTFDLYDKKGKPLPNPDVYIPKTEPDYSGYDAERDRGMEVVLKSDNPGKIAPSFYFPWAPPGRSGADDYRWAIENCDQTVLPFGADLTPEPGMMKGPTRQGMAALIARDPDAYWDASARRVVSSMHPSPRIAIIPLFDPDFYETGRHGGRGASLRAADYLGFFIESMRGDDVIGRVTPVSGLHRGIGPAPVGAFPKSIRLVK